MDLKKTAGIIVLLLLVLSCNEDSEITSGIQGQWQGTLAEVQFKPLGLPIPIGDDDPTFESRIDFSEDGTMVVWNDSDPTEGTYEVTGNELTVNIDYSIEDINLSGTYTIETLTETQLVIHMKKNDTVADPDGGPSVSGQIKVTLHFTRL